MILGIILAIVFFVVLKLLKVSTKVFFTLLWNSLIGLVILFAFNLFSGLFGVKLETNFVNSLVAGIFGIPGIVVLLLLQYL